MNHITIKCNGDTITVTDRHGSVDGTFNVTESVPFLTAVDQAAAYAERSAQCLGCDWSF